MTQDVVITIQGTNDGVTITSGAQAGTVAEDAPDTPSLTDSLSASGTVAFNDVDLTDAHTAGVRGGGGQHDGAGHVRARRRERRPGHRAGLGGLELHADQQRGAVPGRR